MKVLSRLVPAIGVGVLAMTALAAPAFASTSASAGDGQNTGAVWGTGVYTDDSSLATAAVHAGIVKVGQKAVVKVTILPGEQQYTGSDRNGIISIDWRDWLGSYRIDAEKK